MPTTLQHAIAELERLPADEQERFGKWLLEELHAERGWEKRFEESGDVLKLLADDARSEHATGQTKDLDPEKL